MVGAGTGIGPDAASGWQQLARLSGLASVVGLAGGAAAFVLARLIALLTNLALFGRWGWELPSLRDLRVGPRTYVVAVTAALLVSLLARWAPTIRGHGIPEAMEAVLTRESRIAPPTAVAKPVSAAIAIGSGGPFGAEGPIIVTGGAIGSLLGQVLRVSANERKILLACGAAAGMAATFRAPLAAVVLAIELLLFEFSARAFLPLVVATSIAAGTHSLTFGDGALFSVPTHDVAGLPQLPLFAVLGLCCGLLAVVVTGGLFVVERGYRRLPLDPFWHPVVGAVAFVSCGLIEPRALGVGYDAIDDVLAGRLAVGALVLLGTMKLLAWWLALGSGTSGGTLAPMLLISACFGGSAGAVAQRVWPGSGVSTGAFVLVAMAATFGAATRAPFTAVVFLFELTGDYDAILPLMGATVLASIVARALLRDSIMTEKLSRRGVAVPADYHADALRTTSVAEVMTLAVRTVPAGATVGDAMAEFARSGHGGYPVVDDAGAVVGVVSRSDLLTGALDPSAPVVTVASGPAVTARPDEPVVDALERMLTESVEHLPVLDGEGHLIGLCTRTDVLAARLPHLEADAPQPGWRPARLARGPA